VRVGTGGDDREPVLCYTSWWDCPRQGVTLHDGRPHYFLCEFSAELDDYPDAFYLWPISDSTLERELACSTMFAKWRTQFDRGETPSPIEQDRDFMSLSSSLNAERTSVPDNAIIAEPTWHLDPERSFRERAPEHAVTWKVVPVNPSATP
jgi:hypothetical protein